MLKEVVRGVSFLRWVCCHVWGKLVGDGEFPGEGTIAEKDREREKVEEDVCLFVVWCGLWSFLVACLFSVSAFGEMKSVTTFGSFGLSGLKIVVLERLWVEI